MNIRLWVRRREGFVYLVIGAGLLALALALSGCGTVPEAAGGSQRASETAEVQPRAGGDAETGERTGPDTDAEAGRDLRQDIRDMSRQVTDLSQTIEQTTTTIQETVQSQRSGRAELSGQVAEAIEKIGTLEQRVETVVDNSQQVAGLKSELGQVAERMGDIETLVQKTESTVQNYGISKERREVEQERARRQWTFTAMAGLVLSGIAAAAFAADGPRDWWGKLAFFAIAGFLVFSAVGVYLGS